MTREEIVNSNEYKATNAALDWWYSLPQEQKDATNIDAEPDIIDAYTEGYLKALQERDKLLDKACEWWTKYLVDYLQFDKQIISDFRKAMKGGEE